MYNSIYTKSNIIYNDKKKKKQISTGNRGEERNGMQRGLEFFCSDGNIL